jgi:toxin ParE1/3/4
MKLRYTDRALEDIELAFAWYERQKKGLGFEFLDNLEACIEKINDQPEMYQILYAKFRGCVIRRFPFSVFYTIELHEIVVHSVFDNRQDPAKRPWQA